MLSPNDAQPVVRAGLVALLSRQANMKVEGEAATGQETLALFPI